MTATIKVWPTKATAVDMVHPHGPPLAVGGAEWPEDSFTARRLRDGSASTKADKGFKTPKDDEADAPRTEPVKPDVKGTAEGRSAVGDVKAG